MNEQFDKIAARGQSRVLVIEQLDGGFLVCDRGDCETPPRRSVVPNVDALIGAVNRWHRDGQRSEHD